MLVEKVQKYFEGFMKQEFGRAKKVTFAARNGRPQLRMLIKGYGDQQNSL